jgi:hypothetical protein
MNNRIFVFGSNEAGIHGAGAAKFAYTEFGAKYGKGYGHYGQSFAIPTKDMELKSLQISKIQLYVGGFLAYAHAHRKQTFQVTRIGCGLAGFTNQAMAPLFLTATKNCQFDEKWREFLGDQFTYWGTL